MGSWLRLALHPATVRRAAVTAAVVGSVLVGINHGAAIARGEMTPARLLQAGLTVVVPYVVSTASSVSTRRELLRQERLAGAATRRPEDGLAAREPAVEG
ncbi:hypothetical protein FBQ97_10600 [Acidobacteria bacterium ACD]|nr:MAG: hypothetical protein EDX89_19225 [Acidobacteriota bacterium]MDL1950249.1 hypothetical protein [Acidobacteria bacterium ACD]